MEQKNLKVFATILAIDKDTRYDEMIFRYMVKDTENNKYALFGGELKEGIDASECLMNYVKEQAGLDIMKAGEDQAILGYTCESKETDKDSFVPDDVILFNTRIQLQYIKKLAKENAFKTKVNPDGETVWAFDLLDPEEEAIEFLDSSNWEDEEQRQLLVDQVKNTLGEDYLDEDDLEDDDDEEWTEEDKWEC